MNKLADYLRQVNPQIPQLKYLHRFGTVPYLQNKMKIFTISPMREGDTAPLLLEICISGI